MPFNPTLLLEGWPFYQRSTSGVKQALVKWIFRSKMWWIVNHHRKFSSGEAAIRCSGLI